MSDSISRMISHEITRWLEATSKYRKRCLCERPELGPMDLNSVYKCSCGGHVMLNELYDCTAGGLRQNLN